MTRVGFVGLGVMGAPMAGHLIATGHDVAVWNRTPSKSEPLRALGATVAPNLAVLAADCGVVMLCVNRTEDVRECLAALMPAARPGTLFVDHSTISVQGAREIHAEVARRGLRFIDAPITGGSIGAVQGTLTVFCGGDAGDVGEASPWLEAYARRIAHVGGPGAGQSTKAANQIAVAGTLLAMCEALAFAEKAGLDVETTRDLLAGGAAGSWALDHYGPKIVARDWTPGFSVENQLKDLGYCNEAAREVDANVPGTWLVASLLGVLESKGRGGEATAALFDVLADYD